MSTPEITYHIILPIFLLIGTAALVDQFLNIDPQSLSRLLIYLFSPALVFRSIAFMEITPTEAGQLIGAGLVNALLVGVVGYGVARAAGFDRRLESAFVLSVVLYNAGNYGISLNRLAFGQAGEERAVLAYLASAILANTVGVYLASRGSISNRSAMLNVLKVPMPYMFTLGMIVNVGGITLPAPVVSSVDMTADAAIPGMIAVLGIQLSRTWKNGLAQIKDKMTTATLAASLRLLLAPVIAVPLTLLFGLAGLSRDVAIVQASMPTAVLSGVLATEFGADAEHVTATILISTIGSIATLSILLSLLM